MRRWRIAWRTAKSYRSMEAGPAGLTAVFDQRQRLLGIAESDGAGALAPPLDGWQTGPG